MKKKSVCAEQKPREVGVHGVCYRKGEERGLFPSQQSQEQTVWGSATSRRAKFLPQCILRLAIKAADVRFIVLVMWLVFNFIVYSWTDL